MMNTLLAPALGLMQALRLPTKLAGMALLVSLPLAWLTSLALSDLSRQLHVTHEEGQGSVAVSRLLAVAVQVQTRRGQTNMLLSGNAQAAEALKQTNQRLGAAVQAAHDALQANAHWGGLAQWQALQPSLAAMARELPHGERTALFKQHTAQVASLRQLVKRLGEDSQLLFDPEAPTFFLMDLAVEHLLDWTEQLGLLRGQGAGLLTAGNASVDEVAAVISRLGTLDHRLADVTARLDALQRSGEPAPNGMNDALGATQRFAELVNTSFQAHPPQGDPQTYFQTGTQAIQAVVAFSDAVGQRLSTLLTEREHRLRRDRQLALGLSLVSAALMLYLGLALWHNITHGLGRIERSSLAGAQGDLTQRAAVPGRDDLAQVGRSLDRMAEHLSSLVRQIRQHADHVAHTGQGMATQSHALSDRSSQQAASVEQCAASLEEVAQTVRSTAATVQQVHQLFDTTRRNGEDSQQRMATAVHTVEAMAQTSRQVTEIVSVIDGIAFQTNILALNAAVEAARAGESGRGFAVVAGEVRLLAQRSAEAASQIKGLINASVEQVERGVAAIHGARDSVGGIFGQIDRVSQSVSEVADAARQQTDALAQVAEAIRHIDQSTQANASTAEQTASAAAMLQQQADALKGLVAQLRVAA